jgi:RNA polymerase primary sigma factor
VLATDEERVLAERAAGGCAASRERLIVAHLGLVVTIARRYKDCGLAMEDLVAEGTVGLVRAVDRFDPGRGPRLAVYADYWVRLAIREALSNTASAIRLPNHMVRLLARWRRVELRLGRGAAGPPPAESVAAALGLKPGKAALVRDALAASRLRFGAAPAPREGTVDDRPDMGRDEPLDAIARSEELERFSTCMGCLETDERLVLSMRFGLDGGEPRSLAAIGNRLGLSAEWVRRAQLRALARLARWMGRPGPAGAPAPGRALPGGPASP